MYCECVGECLLVLVSFKLIESSIDKFSFKQKSTKVLFFHQQAGKPLKSCP